jgi:Zn-dependent protease with chaperone function
MIKHGVPPPRVVVGSWVLALLSVPPAFVIGWISRLSVLGMSRARELAADAAAATLTGPRAHSRRRKRLEALEIKIQRAPRRA